MGNRGHDRDTSGKETSSPLRRPAAAKAAMPGAHRRILALQAAAGNAATTKWLQASPEAGVQRQGPEPEESWQAAIKGHLGENKSVYHTINNFGDKQLSYVLRLSSTGHAMVSLETQYTYRGGEPQRAWIALSAQRGQTQEVTNGLPPRSALRLRLFGERDHTQPNQSYYEGTVEVRRKK